MKGLRDLARRLGDADRIDPRLVTAHRVAVARDLDLLPLDERDEQVVLRTIRDALHCGFRHDGDLQSFDRAAGGIPEFDCVEPDPVFADLLAEVNERIHHSVFD